jgi:hypothetical protein
MMDDHVFEQKNGLRCNDWSLFEKKAKKREILPIYRARSCLPLHIYVADLVHIYGAYLCADLVHIYVLI